VLGAMEVIIAEAPDLVLLLVLEAFGVAGALATVSGAGISELLLKDRLVLLALEVGESKTSINSEMVGSRGACAAGIFKTLRDARVTLRGGGVGAGGGGVSAGGGRVGAGGGGVGAGAGGFKSRP